MLLHQDPEILIPGPGDASATGRRANQTYGVGNRAVLATNTPFADARGTILAMPGRSLMADAAPALASHQMSAGVVRVATEGSAFVRSTLACCVRSRRWRRCSLRRWRLAYRSRTHSATGAFHGCCGDGWFFNRLRGLKPSSFAMRTSAGESRQRRAASAHALSSATFSAIDALERSLNAKRPACTG